MAQAPGPRSLGGRTRDGYTLEREVVGSGRDFVVRDGIGMAIMKTWKRAAARTLGSGVVAMIPALMVCAPGVAMAQEGAPKLVVTVVVDQLRPDVLEHYAPAFDGGLRRLLDDGFRFTRATHGHARTATAPGHATLSTGVFPSRHGVVANSWQQRVGFQWQPMYAVADPEAPILGLEHVTVLEGRSPKTMLRDGLPDWISQHDSDARTVSISRKDRGAVPLGGRTSEHVYWMIPELAQFVTSTHYRDGYPGWLRDFNAERMPEIFDAEVWESEIPERFRDLHRADSASYEFDGVHTAFPHVASSETPDTTWQTRNVWRAELPYADEAVLELSLVAIDELELGQRDEVDYLALSFSAPDRVGHQFGPFSPEVFQTLLELDDRLDRLFDALDRDVGAGRWVVGFSSDHGVVTMPEHARTLGVEHADRVIREETLAKLSESLSAAAAGGGTPGDVARRLAERVASLDEVAATYTHHELMLGTPADTFAVLYRNSHYPGRAWGELARWGVEIRFGEDDYVGFPTGTNHESAYYYDRAVPMIFLGGSVQAGRSDDPVYTVDFAPTLAALAGIRVPDDLDGRRIY